MMSSPSRSRAAAPRVAAEPLESRFLLSAGPRVILSARPGFEGFATGAAAAMQVEFDQAMRQPGTGAAVLTKHGNPDQTFVATSVMNSGDLRATIRFGVTFEPGSYELRLRSGDGLFESLDGADLDGELTGPFPPSGDGEAGGDFVLPFTLVPFSFVPLSPKLIEGYPLSDHEVELRWFADDSNGYGHVVERADGDGPFREIARVAGTGHTWRYHVDATAAPGVVYRYRVRIYELRDSEILYSPYSDVVTSTTLSPDLTVPVQGLVSTPGARPDWMTDVGGTLYFTMSKDYPGSWRDSAGVELWRSDGTAAGTTRLYSGSARDLIDLNGTLFFTGHDAQAGHELWKSDGTAAGTVRVADLKPGTASSNPRLLAVEGGRLFFGTHKSGGAWEVWQTNGTAEGTVRASDRLAFLDEYTYSDRRFRKTFAASGGGFYFRRADDFGNDTAELWRTDGTPGGTTRVPGITDPDWLLDFDGTLFLAADTEQASGRGLFKVAEDVGGAAAGELVARTEFAGTGYGYLADLARVGDSLYFSGETPFLGIQLYRSDGTAATAVVGRVNTTNSGPEQYNIVDAGGTAYFFNSQFPPSLWKSDGTAIGTVAVARYDFTFRFPTRSPTFLLPAGGQVVYSEGFALWFSDGTRRGSRKVAFVGEELPILSSPGFAGRAALVVGDKIFFSAKLSGGGRELRVASVTSPQQPDGLAVAPAGAAAPASGSRRAAAAQGLALSWADRSANETGFVIERSTRADFATLDGVILRPADSTSAVDDAAAPGVQYFYRVRAVNAGGDSAYSNTAASVASVAGRYVFYNNSAFDGRSAAASAADDSAIAFDKQALLDGQTPTSANYTGYARGLNGVMLYVAGLWDDPAPGDFDFAVGAGGGGTSAWADAPTPLVSVRRGGGASGTDRVTLTNARTGLSAPDVFYFGNLVGETGNAAPGAAAAAVEAGDLLATRRARTAGASNLPGVFDFNGDGRVNVLDEALVRSAQGRTLSLSAAASPAAAPVVLRAAQRRTPYRPLRLDVL